MFNDFYTALRREATGIPASLITEEKASRLFRHLEELEEKGKLFNLTAITDPDEARNKHIIDCLYCAKEISRLADGKAASLIDIGSGAGFPSLPIAFTLENVSVSALDSTARKCTFIAETAVKCGVNVGTVPERAEEAALHLRESFDFATARAVARLNILAELSAPFVKVGGYFVAMKGSAAGEEIAEAAKATETLGLTFSEMLPYEIKDGGTRYIVIYKKTSETPSMYPRSYSKIKKKPL